MLKTTAQKFTFDTEFAGSEDRQAPTAQARQKQTLTVEELENLKTLATELIQDMDDLLTEFFAYFIGKTTATLVCVDLRHGY